MQRIFIRLVWVFGMTIFWSLLIRPSTIVAAPGDIQNCTVPLNMSHSEGYVSVDPLLLSDASGAVHLLWAERLIGEAGDIPNVPDSLMYARWDGAQWSKPIDIFISPPHNFNKKIAGIRGVIDDQGIIHLVWMGPDETFFYSFAHADEAGTTQGWQPPLLLDNEHTGTQYSVDIVYTLPQTLHIAYGRSESRVNRTLAYIRSDDGGLTWSKPTDIHVFLDFERGASNVRLHVNAPDKLYATWTEWDMSGNGQAVYFTRSLDNGLHWDQPVLLDARVDDEYERDWTNLAVLGEDHLIAFWEGGFRAYPQAQYSTDGGVTWSEPIDTLFWLIADNGYAEFERDSLGRLHLFIARRIREGYSEKCTSFPGCTGEGNAIWHSIWEAGPNWREPEPVFFEPVNFISAAIHGGNQVTFAWFDYTNLDVSAMHCEIADAPALALQALPTVVPTTTPEPTSTTMTLVQSTPPPQFGEETSSTRTLQSSTQAMVFASFVPACAILLLVIFIRRKQNRF